MRASIDGERAEGWDSMVDDGCKDRVRRASHSSPPVRARQAFASSILDSRSGISKVHFRSKTRRMERKIH